MVKKKAEAFEIDERVTVYAEFIIQLQVHCWHPAAIGEELANITEAMRIVEDLTGK